MNTATYASHALQDGFAPELRARREESGGSLRTGDPRGRDHWGTGRVENADALERQAFEQIRGILSGHRSVGF